MIKTRNCLRLGQVLMDEKRQFFILCNNCHTDIKNMPDFRRHLEKCKGTENIFRDDHILKFNRGKSTQLFSKAAKGNMEYLIYDYSDVDVQFLERDNNIIDLINIEEELLDPKWYSDTCQEINKSISQKSGKQYDILVEEVTPFVQFKENVKSNSSIQTITKGKCINAQTNNNKIGQKLNQKSKEITTMKRKLSTSTSKPEHPNTSSNQTVCETDLQSSKLSPIKPLYQVPLLKRCRAEEKTTLVQKLASAQGTPKNLSIAPIENHPPQLRKYNQPSSASTVSHNPKDIPKILSQKSLIQSTQPAKENQTAQILNKLQNLGLQVKRTHCFPTPTIDASKKPDDKTLEILLKLQSKGMKVKVLNKQSTAATTTADNFHVSSDSQTGNVTQTRSNQTNVATKQSSNKNLIIRKVK